MLIGRCRGLFVVLMAAHATVLIDGCSSIERSSVIEHEPTVERLRFRAELAAQYLVAGEFKRLHSLGGEQHRREIASVSKTDQRRDQKDFEAFVRRERPLSEILDVELNGRRARVVKRVSVLSNEGSRVYEVVYDHWVFENGDWFFDEVDRTE